MESIKVGRKQNTARRFNGGGPRPDNNKSKQDEAKERAEAWQKLSPVQQLKALDARFGEGKGAGRQRARILAGIEKAKNRPAAEPKKAPEQVVQSEGDRLKAKDRRAQERKERPSK
jgi:hypothetical protein